MASYLSMYKIIDYVYICDKQKAMDLDNLEEKNIKGMLYLNPSTKSQSVLDDYTEIKIHHYHISMKDNIKLDFSPFIQNIINIIKHFETKKLNILVYCDTGTRLAPIAVIFYILYKQYIIDGIIPKKNPITPMLLKSIQYINNDIDFHNIYNAIQQLVLFEINLKKK